MHELIHYNSNYKNQYKVNFLSLRCDSAQPGMWDVHETSVSYV
jgi:hypothetical protein